MINLRYKRVFRAPQMPGEARRCVISEEKGDYYGLMIMLPCHHLAVFDNSWNIKNLNDDNPTITQVIDCHANNGGCWYGYLVEGMFQTKH